MFPFVVSTIVSSLDYNYDQIVALDECQASPKQLKMLISIISSEQKSNYPSSGPTGKKSTVEEKQHVSYNICSCFYFQIDQEERGGVIIIANILPQNIDYYYI